MKKLIVLAFVLLTATACTPEEMASYLRVQEEAVPTIAVTDRQAGLTLPATGHTEVVWGETVNVVAWVGDRGEADGYFVFDGVQQGLEGRWLVMDNAEPAHAYIYRVTEDPCFADPFGVIRYDPAVCGAIPV